MVATSWLVIKQIQLTLKSMTAEVPKNGMGVGPGIPSFLNTVYGAMQYLKIQGNKSDDDWTVNRLEENKGDFHDRQDSSYMTPLKRSDWSSTQWQTPQYDWRSWLSWTHFLSFWKMLSFKVFWSCLLRIVSQQIFMGPFFRNFILRRENF